LRFEHSSQRPHGRAANANQMKMFFLHAYDLTLLLSVKAAIIASARHFR